MENQIKVHRGKGSIKLYANVPSRSRSGKTHMVTYIRQPGRIERWNCTCEDQTMNRTAKHQNCQHIKMVKSKGIIMSNGRPVLMSF